MRVTEKSLAGLYQKIKEREQRAPLSFKEFMELAGKSPRVVFRNIFQTFYDMIYNYIGKSMDEYLENPDSADFVCHECSKLFIEGADHPFFADRLFTNRLLGHIATFRRGIRQNRIYIFEGPHGCGKSTFLNNLLQKFEQYTRTEGGASYETVWRLNRKELGAETDSKNHPWAAPLNDFTVFSAISREDREEEAEQDISSDPFSPSSKEYLEVPCPSHDSPLLLIPKAYRREMLNEMIEDEEFKRELFSEKQYEWVFKDNPCTICTSLYHTMLDMFDSPTKAFEMVYARRYIFNRRLGQGISVFNPGDRIARTNVLTNQLLQDQLNNLFRDSNRVKYLYSRYANTNNGVYALMDIKAHNRERLANLHGIISEGVHKVEDIEENVSSLFLATMNPEDRGNIEDTQSFSDRITFVKVSYILDYNTEVKIYKNIFGEQIEGYFLPRVLENFAKVIIATRLHIKSQAMSEWIQNPDRYRLYCDRNLQLLKMDVYAGVIPEWLTEEDKEKLTASRRRKITAEAETEGDKGFTGRDSIRIFSEFFSAYARKDKLITMTTLCNFFKNYTGGENSPIPAGFLESLLSHYNYTVLQQVKESLYFYNEERIARDIQNYLFAVNFDPERTERCIFTGEEIEITEEFFSAFERRILGTNSLESKRRSFRKDIQNQYASRTLTQEILVEGKEIHQTEIYQGLYQKYVHNLKENVLDPFLKNANFRNAIKDYGTDSFRTYDKRIREDITLLMHNLHRKYGYTQQGAKEVCIYVIDSGLAATFSSK